MKHDKKINPEDFLHLENKTYVRVNNIQWNNMQEHDHCQFCWKKNSQYSPCSGYYSLDKYYWICEECFDEYKYAMNFKIIGNILCYKDLIDFINIEIGSLQDTKCFNILRLKELFRSISKTNIMFQNNAIIIIKPAIINIYPNPKIKPTINIMHDIFYVIYNNDVVSFMNSILDLEKEMKQFSIEEHNCYVYISSY